MLTSLPPEVLERFVRMLPAEDQARAACACRTLHRATLFSAMRDRARDVADMIVCCFEGFGGEFNGWTVEDSPTTPSRIWSCKPRLPPVPSSYGVLEAEGPCDRYATKTWPAVEPFMPPMTVTFRVAAAERGLCAIDEFTVVFGRITYDMVHLGHVVTPAEVCGLMVSLEEALTSELYRPMRYQPRCRDDSHPFEFRLMPMIRRASRMLMHTRFDEPAWYFPVDDEWNPRYWLALAFARP